jgi:hypothetical protein
MKRLPAKGRSGSYSIDKETCRTFLYRSVDDRSARAIASVLGEGLPESEIRALEEELKSAPSKESLKKLCRSV